MKDQYAGDVNDYSKYALLLALSAAYESRLNVCWMRTDPDGGGDGGKIGYLAEPERFRAFDPALFDVLASLVAGGVRNLEAIQALNILPNAHLHTPKLSDTLAERERYFEAFWPSLEARDLVFFDPDNGFGVASVPKGKRKSSKYLYWDEFVQALGEDRAVCVYQHFPRCPRRPFVTGLLERIVSSAPGHDAFALIGSWVAYLVCAPAEHAHRLRAAADDLAGRPGSPLTLMS
jgi:hypothetical protein